MIGRMIEELPTIRPHTPLLDAVSGTRSKLGELENHELVSLAEELRHDLLYCVAGTGGHFGAGLGVVELTVALHHVLNTPHDRIVWDVGHQTYPHKILTGRRDQMNSMRQLDGLSGFPKRSESPFDTFGVGHSSTSISAAMGMALAAEKQGIDRKVVAVIGDGAITGGMAFEALAHAGHERPNMLVILNDNQMSIGHNTGGLATYFAKIWASKTYTALREGSKKILEHVRGAWDLAKRTEEHMKGMVAPGTMFEELFKHGAGCHHALHMLFGSFRQIPGATHMLKNLFGSFSQSSVRFAGPYLGEVGCEAAGVVSDRHLIVVEDDQHVGPLVASMCQGFKSHTAGDGAISDDRHDFSINALFLCRQCHAHCRRNAGGGMPDAKGIERALAALGEAR